jgi:hypothetical protein
MYLPGLNCSLPLRVYVAAGLSVRLALRQTRARNTIGRWYRQHFRIGQQTNRRLISDLYQRTMDTFPSRIASYVRGSAATAEKERHNAIR